MIVADGKEARERAAKIVAEGGVIAFRTDTFYGLGADPFNVDALRAINLLKGREGGKPILVIISGANEADRFIAHRSELFDALKERFWPGALTLVATARADVPEQLTAGTGTIGVRLPDEKGVRDFVRACGGALTATSANLAGRPPARTADEVMSYFTAGLSLIIDGGVARSDRPSTVLDVSVSPPRLIREGAVSWKHLQSVLDPLGVGLQPIEGK